MALMKNSQEEAFKKYKKAETKALEILNSMKATGAGSVDIELSLLVAIYELHKEKLPAGTISNIVKGHLNTLEPYYGGVDPSAN